MITTSVRKTLPGYNRKFSLVRQRRHSSQPLRSHSHLSPTIIYFVFIQMKQLTNHVSAYFPQLLLARDFHLHVHLLILLFQLRYRAC